MKIQVEVELCSAKDGDTHMTFVKSFEAPCLIPIGQQMSLMPSGSKINNQALNVDETDFNIAECCQTVYCYKGLEFSEDDGLFESVIAEFIAEKWEAENCSEPASQIVERLKVAR